MRRLCLNVKMQGMYIKWKVSKEDDGLKAEQVLRKRLGFSGALCRRIRNGAGLLCDGKFHLNAAEVREGNLLEVRLTAEDELEGPLEPKEPIPIRYEDEWFALVSKPPFTPTHPRFPGDRGLISLLSDKTLHPANRLDMDTSGLTVIAKNAYAHDRLSRTPMQKIYLGLVHGIPPERGIIDAPIGRAPDSIILRRVTPEGKEARTHFVRVAAWPESEAALLAFRLETGRTHQIRVHCQYKGFPLAGDTLYGWEQTFRCRSEIRGRNRANYLMEDHRRFDDPSLARDFKALALNRLLRRQFLHAERLHFIHPISGEELKIHDPLPPDLLEVLRWLNLRSKPEGAILSPEPLFGLELPANVRD